MVSVVIPMYNAAESIIRCIDSVVNQTYKGNIEIIIINDGSTDDSLNVAEKYKLKSDNLNIKIFSQVNRGVSAARNYGLREAKGEYIALLDSDDEWFLQKLEKQIGYLEINETIDFLGASFDGFGLKNKKDGYLLKVNFKDLLFKNYFQPSTVLFKKEILDKVGYFDETQRYAEEGNFFMRVAKEFNCFFLNTNLINFGDGKAGFGERGLSANLKEMEKGELKNLKFVYKKGWINPVLYVFTVSFSLLKYFRRILIVKFR